MIIRMNTKAPRTKSPDGGAADGSELVVGLGADHVYNVFREDDTPVPKLISILVVMQMFFFAGLLAAIPTSGVTLVVSVLILTALPFAPGVIVRREFRNDVIPACRNVCSESEIVSGALKCLRYLWGRYLLGLLPAIVIVVGFFSSEFGSKPFRELGWPIILSFAVILLGECALAVFPVARLFSRRAGMIVVLILIILGKAVLLATAVYGASGLLWFTDGDPHVKEYTVFTFRLIFVCTVVFGGGLGYFIRAASKDAEKKGLIY